MNANPWFAGLPLADRRALLQACERQRLAPGEMLFRQGDNFCQAVNINFEQWGGVEWQWNRFTYYTAAVNLKQYDTLLIFSFRKVEAVN